MEGISDICDTSGLLVSSSIVNNKTDIRVYKYQGRGLFKANTFYLWYIIGTIVRGITVDFLHNFIGGWVQEGTKDASIAWDAIMGEGEARMSNELLL